jgi:hypothetical protein
MCAASLPTPSLPISLTIEKEGFRLRTNEVNSMSSDMQLKKHVEDELNWEPSVNAAAIGVVLKMRL